MHLILLNLEPRFDLINWFRCRWPSGLIDWCTSKRTSKWRVPNIWRERDSRIQKQKKQPIKRKHNSIQSRRCHDIFSSWFSLHRLIHWNKKNMFSMLLLWLQRKIHLGHSVVGTLRTLDNSARMLVLHWMIDVMWRSIGFQWIFISFFSLLLIAVSRMQFIRRWLLSINQKMSAQLYLSNFINHTAFDLIGFFMILLKPTKTKSLHSFVYFSLDRSF